MHLTEKKKRGFLEEDKKCYIFIYPMMNKSHDLHTVSNYTLILKHMANIKIKKMKIRRVLGYKVSPIISEKRLSQKVIDTSIVARAYICSAFHVW